MKTLSSETVIISEHDMNIVTVIAENESEITAATALLQLSVKLLLMELFISTATTLMKRGTAQEKQSDMLKKDG